MIKMLNIVRAVKEWFFNTEITKLIGFSFLAGGVLFCTLSVMAILLRESGISPILFVLALTIGPLAPFITILIRDEMPWVHGKTVKGKIPRIIGWGVIIPMLVTGFMLICFRMF